MATNTPLQPEPAETPTRGGLLELFSFGFDNWLVKKIHKRS